MTEVADLIKAARSHAGKGGGFDARRMAQWTAEAAKLCDARGRVTPPLQEVIFFVEKELGARFSRGARALFQQMVGSAGGRLKGAISMPLQRVPYWQTGKHPLADFRSTAELPRRADVVVIGAGLTGASAAYHLSKEIAAHGRSVVILDAGDPATQASGRNGGNFELIPENFFGGHGSYDGYVRERRKFLGAAYPKIDAPSLQRQAERIGETMIRFALKNAARMFETIATEKIDCDLSRAGWLRIALNRREEAGIKEEVELGQRLGADIHFVRPETIRKRYRLPAEYGGRIVGDNGNYHPFKLVCGELHRAIQRGVKLYTRTPVGAVRSRRADHHELETPRGTLIAKRLIVATNAFTSRLFPELSDIRCIRAQIANFGHTLDPLRGITMTARDGDIYAMFPGQDRYVDSHGARRGTLHIGGGKDKEELDPFNVRPLASVFHMSRREAACFFPDTEGRPASRVWAGPMAFVEGTRGMRMPVLGPLGSGVKQGIFVAVFCNGFGGSGCHNAGAGAAEWALTGEVPSDMPQDVFGVARLFDEAPLFPLARRG